MTEKLGASHGLSWNGFNVVGDEKSIKEVRRLMRQDEVARYMCEEVERLRARTVPKRSDEFRIRQKALIADLLRRAYEPLPDGSSSISGWPCAANLVQHWLEHPSDHPVPDLRIKPTLRGLVFIDEDGTIRKVDA